MELLTLSQIRGRVYRLAKVIAAPPGSLPSFGTVSELYIEVTGAGYHYVSWERGHEFDRRTTRDVDELAYWIFETITSSMAWKFELPHRIPDQDCRRLAFEKQLDLLSNLSPEWAKRQEAEQREILRRHPFDDMARTRAILCVHLRDQGHEGDVADALADERFPPPIPEIIEDE
ncbi:MAG: Imm63 family immunity protein [Planctomycetaceae bacterium]